MMTVPALNTVDLITPIRVSKLLSVHFLNEKHLAKTAAGMLSHYMCITTGVHSSNSSVINPSSHGGFLYNSLKDLLKLESAGQQYIP